MAKIKTNDEVYQEMQKLENARDILLPSATPETAWELQRRRNDVQSKAAALRWVLGLDDEHKDGSMSTMMNPV